MVTRESGQELLGKGRLKGCKAKLPFFVMGQYELHRTVTEVTDPIEEDDRLLV